MTSKSCHRQGRARIPSRARIRDPLGPDGGSLGEFYIPPEPPGASSMRVIDPTRWEGEPVPEREWIVPECVPAAAVTILAGEGAAGKSTLALQLAVARGVGKAWLNTMPKPGRTLVLSAEDDEDELHRRLDAIRQHYEVQLRRPGGSPPRRPRRRRRRSRRARQAGHHPGRAALRHDGGGDRELPARPRHRRCARRRVRRRREQPQPGAPVHKPAAPPRPPLRLRLPLPRPSFLDRHQQRHRLERLDRAGATASAAACSSRRPRRRTAARRTRTCAP